MTNTPHMSSSHLQTQNSNANDRIVCIHGCIPKASQLTEDLVSTETNATNHREHMRESGRSGNSGSPDSPDSPDSQEHHQHDYGEPQHLFYGMCYRCLDLQPRRLMYNNLCPKCQESERFCAYCDKEIFKTQKHCDACRKSYHPMCFMIVTGCCDLCVECCKPRQPCTQSALFCDTCLYADSDSEQPESISSS